MPGYWGRMDHGWRAGADCSEHCRHEPSSYLRKLWLDRLVFDREQLDSLVRTHGAEKLCLGTDYPFDMAEPDQVGFRHRLSEDDQAKDPRPQCGAPPGAGARRLSDLLTPTLGSNGLRYGIASMAAAPLVAAVLFAATFMTGRRAESAEGPRRAPA